MSVVSQVIDVFKSVNIGALRDGLTSVLCLLFGALVGGVRKHLNRKQLMVLTAILGVFELKSSYDHVVLIYLLDSVLGWLLIYFSRKTGNYKYLIPSTMALQVFVLGALDVLARVHDPEWSHRRAAIMQLVVRIHMTACCVVDGSRKDEELSSRQRTYKIAPAVTPSLLEYVCYCFYFATAAFGPDLEYNDWAAFMDGPEAEEKMSLDAIEKRLVFHRPELFRRSRAMVILSDIVIGGAMILLWVLLGHSQFSVEYMASDEFKTHGFIYRIFIIPIVMRVLFAGKYCFAWLFSDAGTTLAGFGKREGVWGATRNIEPTSYFAPSFADMNLGWNVSVNRWLRFYLYEPVMKSDLFKKMPEIVKLLTPFTVSALWHSVHWCYLLTFWFAALATQVARQARRTFTTLERRISNGIGRSSLPGFVVDSLYYTLSWILTQWFYAFGILFFCTRGDISSLYAAKNLYFLGYIIIAVGLVFPWSALRKMFGVKPEEWRLLNNDESWVFGPHLLIREQKRKENDHDQDPVGEEVPSADSAAK